MPKASVLQGNFNSGELSPLLYGQATLPKYKAGLETALNYVPTLQGPLVRRPGSKYVAAVKDSANPPVLIPFQFSLTQAYMLEFGDQYIRFFANGGQVVFSSAVYAINGGFRYDQSKETFGQFTALRASNVLNAGESATSATLQTIGAVMELQSYYAVADVAKIKWAQQADTLYLYHPNYPTYKLQRFSQNEWQLWQVGFQDGPYLAPNSYQNFGDSTTTTLTTGSSFSTVPSLQAGPAFTVAGAALDSGTGQVKITTSSAHGYLTGQKIFTTLIGGTTEANCNDFVNTYPGQPYYWTITVTSSTTFLLNGSVFTHAFTSGGNVMPALFWQNFAGQTKIIPQPDRGRLLRIVVGTAAYFGTINSIDSAGSVTLWRGQAPTPNPANLTAAAKWYLGVYCTMNGYPACGTFHQDRQVLGGAPGVPQECDGSVVADYENFSPSDRTNLNVASSNAFSFNLNSRDVNIIRWLSSSAQGLLAGSSSAEWMIAPNSANEPLTATNVNATETSFYGSADADAVQLGNASLYVQRAQRKLREMNYFFQVGTFRSSDMTELSEHITLPAITKLAVQKETQPLVWAVRSDGALVAMIYDRSDVHIQAGWTRHFLGGQSDAAGTPPAVTSIGIIPSKDTTFDQLWMVVKRWVNGAAVYYIEYLTKVFDDSFAQEDAFQLDCGATYDSPLTITGVSIANPAVITAPAHGLSNGNEVRFSNIVGLNIATTDINGNVSYSNLLNGNAYLVTNVTTNTFQITDLLGNAISSVGASVFISGQVRKMVTTISGLTWLKNETVGVLADGAAHPDAVVSGTGSVTLQFPAAKVQIGYRYNSDGKLLRAEAGAADGTSIGKTRRTERASFMVHRTGDLSVGTDFNNLIPVTFDAGDTLNTGQAPPLYSGIARVGIESKYDFDSQVCWRQNSPLPGIIQAISSFMEEFDV